MTAQMLSLVVSLVLNLIVPKFLPLLEYSMWQVYILYASFVGLFHFGLMDGVLLKYSKFDYEELDKPIIRAHFITLLIILFFSAGLCLGLGFIFNPFAKPLIYLLSVAVIVKNLCVFSLYSFQSTNRIGKYAQLILIQRLTYVVIVGGLLISKNYNYVYYCIADLVADFIGFLFSIIYNRYI